MKSIFVTSVLASFVLWLGVSYYPSRFLYRSENRVFLFQFPLFGLWYLFAVRAVVSWRAFQPMAAPWAGSAGDTRHQFHSCGFLVSVIMVLFALLQAYLSDESNPGGWVVRSPCGASSCTSVELTGDVVFNPRGFYSEASTTSYTDFIPTFCVYDECRWADSNGGDIRGFLPLPNATGYPDLGSTCTGNACLASDRAEDYPDLATGLVNGYFPGFGISLTAQKGLCPGSYVDTTTAIRGRRPCAYCLPYFRKHLHFTSPDVAYCPQSFPDDPRAEDDALWCAGLCPQLHEERTPSAMRHQSEFTNAAASIPLVLWFYLRAMHSVRHTNS